MDDAASEHPDEGTIHAWLDGALDAPAARALETHVATCRTCSERVAEARGLIAGASRIVRALDDAPSGGSPTWGSPAPSPTSPADTRSAWRRLRVTPARAAIAATVLVALGVSLTYRRTAVEPVAPREVAAPAAAMRPEVGIASQPRDPLLDSAVARNLAQAQPPRVLKAAPGPEPIVPEPPPAGAAVMADAAASRRVAAARSAVSEQRVATAGVAPDQLSARVPAVAVRGYDEKAVAAGVHADSVTRASAGSMVASGATGVLAPAAARSPVLQVTAPNECIRVESANGTAAAWGSVPLPFIVRLDSVGRASRVLTVAGQPADAFSVVDRAGDDSLLLRLRRLGFEGTLTLGARGDARAGVMRSRPSSLQLESMVATAAPAAEPPAQRRAAARVPVAKSVPTPSRADSADARSAATAAPAVPVVGRRVACPG